MVLYRHLKSQSNEPGRNPPSEALWRAVLFLPAWVLWLLHRLCVSIARRRIRIINEQFTPGLLPEGQNVIYVFWHSKVFMLPLYGRPGKMAALTLLDWKNRIFDRICKFYQIRTVPVRSVTASTRALEHLLRQGYHVALALDGPRGPAGVIRPGALYLAQKTGRPIVCVNLRLRRSLRLHWRWDRLEIPLPLGRGTWTLSPPMEINERNIEEAKQKILEVLPDL